MEKFVHGGNIYYMPPAGGWLDFSANINPLGLAPEVRRAVAENIDGVVNYPDPEARELKRAISCRYEVPRKNIILGNGAAELFYLFFQMVRPASVLIPIPSFSEYERSAMASGAAVRYFHLPADAGLRLDMKVLAEAVAAEGAEAVVIGNPNNPTGQLLETAEIASFLKETVRLANPPWLMIDESFLDFCSDEECYRARALLKNYDRLFIVQSLTKFYALPGLRLGFGLGCTDLIKKLEMGKDVWNVNFLAQKAGVEALKQQEYGEKSVKLVAEEKEFLYKGLGKITGIIPYVPTVNFILLRLENLSSAEFTAAMRQKGILVRDCSNYPGLDRFHVRVAVKGRRENERLLAAALEVCR